MPNFFKFNGDYFEPRERANSSEEETSELGLTGFQLQYLKLPRIRHLIAEERYSKKEILAMSSPSAICALSELQTQCMIARESLFHEVQFLNDAQCTGVLAGANPVEVRGLNNFQVNALVAGLTPAQVKRGWFDERHANFAAKGISFELLVPEDKRAEEFLKDLPVIVALDDAVASLTRMLEADESLTAASKYQLLNDWPGRQSTMELGMARKNYEKEIRKSLHESTALTEADIKQILLAIKFIYAPALVEEFKPALSATTRFSR